MRPSRRLMWLSFLALNRGRITRVNTPGISCWHVPRHDHVAPVIADHAGAHWAGQDRAAPKGSLDAPKRSRKILRPERRIASALRPSFQSKQLACHGARTSAIDVSSERGFGEVMRELLESLVSAGNEARPARIENLVKWLRALRRVHFFERDLRHLQAFRFHCVCRHTVSGRRMSHSVRKHNVQPVRFLHGNHDRQARPLADEQHRVTVGYAQQFSVPAAESRGRPCRGDSSNCFSRNRSCCV
jgi:hypothetical protein